MTKTIKPYRGNIMLPTRLSEAIGHICLNWAWYNAKPRQPMVKSSPTLEEMRDKQAYLQSLDHTEAVAEPTK